MADASVIKSFLVELGFRTDESSSRRFFDLISSSTVKVAEFAAGIEAAAIAVVAAVGRMSSELDKLYFSAIRSGGTAEGIEALGYAFSQVGLSAGQARTAVEGMALAMRSNPGLSGLLKSFGVDTNQPMEKVLQQFVERTNKMAPYIQQQYARMFGIDPTTLMMMRRGLEGYTEEWHQLAEKIGVDTNKAAEAGNYFMQRFRLLGGVFDLLQNKVAETLGRRMGDIIGRFAYFLLDNSETIAAGIERMANIIVFLAETITRIMLRTQQLVQDLIKWWKGLDQSSRDLIVTLGLLAVAWRAFNIVFAMTPIGMVITAIAALGTALLLLYDDYKTFSEYGRQYSLIDWDKWMPSIRAGWTETKRLFKELQDGLDECKAAARELGDALSNLFPQTSEDHVHNFADWMKSGFVDSMKIAGRAIGEAFGGLHALAETMQLMAAMLQGNWSAAWGLLKKMNREDMEATARLLGQDPKKMLKEMEPQRGLTREEQEQLGYAPVRPNRIGTPEDMEKLRQLPADKPPGRVTTEPPKEQRTPTGGQAPPAGPYDVPGFTPASFSGGINSLLRNAAYTTSRVVTATLDDVVDMLRQILEALGRQAGGDEDFGPSGFGGARVQQASFGGGMGGVGSAVAGLGGGGNITASIQERANYIIDEFTKGLNLTPQQAAGVAGKFMSESGLNPFAFNSAGGGHGAFGLAQWRGERQEALAGFVKEHPELSMFQAQVQFAMKELQEKYSEALRQLRQQSTASGSNLSMYLYERSEPFSRYRGGREAEEFMRGYRPSPNGPYSNGAYGNDSGNGVDRQGPTLNQQNHINVQGVSDPHLTVTEIERAQTRINAAALRNMQGAFV